jgi:hypothetical protein
VALKRRLAPGERRPEIFPGPAQAPPPFDRDRHRTTSGRKGKAMKRTQTRCVLLGAVSLALAAGPAGAVVVEFTDRDAWFDAAGFLTTISFTEFPNGTFVTDQYEEWGVLLTDGLDQIICCGENFPSDGAGLFGITSTSLEFTAPQWWIAVDFPGDLIFSLFTGGELVYTSSDSGPSGVGNSAA